MYYGEYKAYKVMALTHGDMFYSPQIFLQIIVTV